MFRDNWPMRVGVENGDQPAVTLVASDIGQSCQFGYGDVAYFLHFTGGSFVVNGFGLGCSMLF